LLEKKPIDEIIKRQLETKQFGLALAQIELRHLKKSMVSYLNQKIKGGGVITAIHRRNWVLLESRNGTTLKKTFGE